MTQQSKHIRPSWLTLERSSPLKTLAWIAIIAITTSVGCIEDGATAIERDGESDPSSLGGATVDVGGDAGGDVSDNVDGDAGGEQTDAGSAVVEEAGETVSAGEQAGEPAGELISEAGDEAGQDLPPDPPPAPEQLPACDRFCQRVEDCLYPRCEALNGLPPRQFCAGWCDSTGDDWLDQGADLSCDDFTRRIYGYSPEMRTLCEADPEVLDCEAICDFGEVCGLVSDDCLANCNSAPDDSIFCFRSATDQESCQRFYSCYGEQPTSPEERYEDVCSGLCNREASCLFEACAPGAWSVEDTQACVETCVDTRPGQRALQARFARSCAEVVEDALAESETFAARCELPDDQICASVCADLVVGCGELTAEECEVRCADWDDANFLCVQSATSCDALSTCLVTPDEQDRCRRSCDRLQSCLEAACPPRIIPPRLSDSCTVNCFEDPISEADLGDWEETSCREVREVVYQDNPQLRPICEGGRDFRPTPEECSAFCESSLDACILGGETICLSACAGMDRGQYECALAAQGECGAIDLCLSE